MDASDKAAELRNKNFKAAKNPNKKSHKNKHHKLYQYGNYSGYYSKRNGSEKLGNQIEDVRLEFLKIFSESHFQSKKVLDIGCNSGMITLSVAKIFNPKAILGIDIDSGLIGKKDKIILEQMLIELISDIARSNLETEKKDPDLENKPEIINSLKNVTFRTANYILKDINRLEFETAQYDTILCLSVTKWIHLNFGDDGIKFLFQRIYKQLNTNGILILEPQSFKTYKKRSKLTPEIEENYKNIKLRPSDFKKYLIDEVGFKVKEYADTNLELPLRHAAQGFNRPMNVYEKK
ncbi:unnamed protein product [Diamesa serratosioi]